MENQTKNQQQKYEDFLALHQGSAIFVMANPWDAGTARLLAAQGFPALATTSAGYAFSKGKRDSSAALSRAEVLANAAEIVAATDLPVSGDLEDGFGAEPECCAQSIRAAISVGLVGGSIEDATGDPDLPIYAFEAAVERVAAAAEAARGQPFLLTARAENYLCGRPDFGDTLRRLQAFSEAGADVLFAPGMRDLNDIRTLCRELDKPVNVVMGLTDAAFSTDQLAEAGVKRISLGGSLARAALGAVMRATTEVLEEGRFTYARDAMPGADIYRLMRGR